MAADVPIVFPVKDGYRDTVSFTVTGTTSTGSAIPVTGTAVLTRSGTQVAGWDLQTSTQRITWSGRVGGKVRVGAYLLTVTGRDGSGHSAVATADVQVSAKKLITAATSVVNTSSTGSHVMIASARKGLGKATVTLRVTTKATGMKGTQKLVFSRNGKRFVVPVKNGVHTSRAIVVPKSFTKFKLSHTWKTGKLLKAKYSYKYKILK